MFDIKSLIFCTYEKHGDKYVCPKCGVVVPQPWPGLCFPDRPKRPQPTEPPKIIKTAKTPEEIAAEAASRKRYQEEAAAAAEALGEPSLVTKGAHYLAALSKWYRAGMPTRTEEEAKRCFEICTTNACGKFDAAAVACKICGCKVSSARWSIFSKTKMATERCPKCLWKL